MMGSAWPKDYASAARGYRKAASHGYAVAKLNLGTLYANGQGVPQDNVQAYRWFSSAARKIGAQDAKHRETAIAHRDRLARSMTPAELERARRSAHPPAKR
jgi:TPR repeat protein